LKGQTLIAGPPVDTFLEIPMKRFLLLLLAVCLLSGCASWRNDIAHKGGLFTEYRGDYVVISESGGVIMDVWVLEDAYVESEENSDGWRFIDNLGQPTNVGGDSKVIRVKDKSQLENYHEYHFERSQTPYHEYFMRDSLSSRYHLRGRVNGFFGRCS
jgi:hypothetical protein